MKPGWSAPDRGRAWSATVTTATLRPAEVAKEVAARAGLTG